MPEKDDNSYESDVTIDENALDFEWQRQAELMSKWARKLAFAVTKRMRAEQHYKVLKVDSKWEVDKERATVDLDIRKYPVDYGLNENPAERAIEKAINRDKEFIKFVNSKKQEVKDAYEAFLECVQDEELYAAAVKSMTDKKKALENLEQLYISQYYGEPKSSNFSQEGKFARSERIGKELKDRLKGRGTESDDSISRRMFKVK